MAGKHKLALQMPRIKRGKATEGSHRSDGPRARRRDRQEEQTIHSKYKGRHAPKGPRRMTDDDFRRLAAGETVNGMRLVDANHNAPVRRKSGQGARENVQNRRPRQGESFATQVRAQPDSIWFKGREPKHRGSAPPPYRTGRAPRPAAPLPERGRTTARGGMFRGQAA